MQAMVYPKDSAEEEGAGNLAFQSLKGSKDREKSVAGLGRGTGPGLGKEPWATQLIQSVQGFCVPGDGADCMACKPMRERQEGRRQNYALMLR